MASTKLDRKARRNIVRSQQKNIKIKRLSFVPVIKKVDAEELKAEFASAKPAKKETKPKAEKKEVVAEVPVEEVKAEAKPKAAPKAKKKAEDKPAEKKDESEA